MSLAFILVCNAFVAHVYFFLSERPCCSLYFPFYSCFRYTAASSDVSFSLDAASYSYGAENQTLVLKSNKYQTKVCIYHSEGPVYGFAKRILKKKSGTHMVAQTHLVELGGSRAEQSLVRRDVFYLRPTSFM